MGAVSFTSLEMLGLCLLLSSSFLATKACLPPPAPAPTTSTAPPVFPENSSKVFPGYPEQCKERHNNPNKNILFLGNSYTYYNDLPGMLRNLASAAGVSATTSSNTPGGQTFEGHRASSIGTINSGRWDVVVLQEQSVKPVDLRYGSLADSIALVEAIRSKDECTIPVFYQTWGRLDGLGGMTFHQMQDMITTSYSAFARASKPASVAPVGEAFRDFGDTRQSLYASDGSHPSPQGSYLAACTMLETIWGISCVGNSFTPGGVSKHGTLQTLATQAVSAGDWDF